MSCNDRGVIEGSVVKHHVGMYVPTYLRGYVYICGGHCSVLVDTCGGHCRYMWGTL